MRGIEEGAHEEDGHGLDFQALQLIRQDFEGTRIEGHQDFALRVDPLGHLEAQLARDQRLVPLVMQVERVGPVGAGDLQHIAEAFRGDQSAFRATPLDQRVDDQRGPVVEEVGLGGLEISLPEAVKDPLDKIPVRRRALGIDHVAGIVIERDKVGEGASDIHGDDMRHQFLQCISFVGCQSRMTTQYSGGRRSRTPSPTSPAAPGWSCTWIVWSSATTAQ